MYITDSNNNSIGRTKRIHFWRDISMTGCIYRDKMIDEFVLNYTYGENEDRSYICKQNQSYHNKETKIVSFESRGSQNVPKGKYWLLRVILKTSLFEFGLRRKLILVLYFYKSSFFGHEKGFLYGFFYFFQ